MQGRKMGIPSIADVQTIKNSEIFSVMSEYSREYLAINRMNLKEYRWIKDAFNQWSRIYEYPYCHEIIKRHAGNDAHVLDAGSGITFFPFYLNAKYKMTCIDQDDYSGIYDAINRKQKTNVVFKQSNLKNISFPDGTFDVIYCISVLEHTNDYDSILKEFCRILKSNGLLVITFDISVNDNTWGIDKDASISLIDNIAKYFKLEYNSSDLIGNLQNKDIYTTRYVMNNGSPDLLPWPRLTLKTKLKNLIFKQKMNYDDIDLTVCTVMAVKA